MAPVLDVNRFKVVRADNESAATSSVESEFLLNNNHGFNSKVDVEANGKLSLTPGRLCFYDVSSSLISIYACVCLIMIH